MIGAMATPCCRVSVGSGEPLYGSVGAHAETLYVSWDSSRWHPKNVLLTDGVPEALRLAVALELERGRKFAVRFFDDRAAADGTVTLKWYPAGVEVRGVALERLADAVADMLGGSSGRLIEGRSPLATLPTLNSIEGRDLFICGDAGHDRCCGKYGPEMLAAAEKIVAEKKLPLRLYRSSHLGGHKFAPTAVVFPEGIVYGRIGRADLPDFLAAVAAGIVYGPYYRGHVGTDVDRQIAVAAAAGMPEFAGRSFRVEDVVNGGVADRRKEIMTTVRPGAGPLRKLTITVVERDFKAAVSCGGEDVKNVARWVIDMVK